MKSIVKNVIAMIFFSSLACASVYKYDYSVSSKDTNWSQNDQLLEGDFQKIIRFSPIYFDDGAIDEDSKKTLDSIKQTIQDLNNSDIIVTAIGYAQEADDKKDEAKIDSQVYGEKIVKFFTHTTTTKESFDNSQEYLDDVVDALDEVYPKEQIIKEARGDSELRFTTESQDAKERSNRVMVAVYVKNPPLKDSDGDGIYDKYDHCPNTIKGLKVDELGCALDSDKDGVLDYMDKCPDSLVGAIVNDEGCSVYTAINTKDSDGDGVLDKDDQCPKTPKGTMVNDKGCTIFKKFIVHFDYKISDVKTEFDRKLDEVAAYMKKYPTYKAKIVGHTDNRGGYEYNMRLSKNRALAVKQELINRGIAAERLTTDGKGYTQPVTTNQTDAGRAKNRRTEIELY